MSIASSPIAIAPVAGAGDAHLASSLERVATLSAALRLARAASASASAALRESRDESAQLSVAKFGRFQTAADLTAVLQRQRSLGALASSVLRATRTASSDLQALVLGRPTLLSHMTVFITPLEPPVPSTWLRYEFASTNGMCP